jgi:hypothetical protein
MLRQKVGRGHFAALKVAGVAAFSRSGVATMPAGKSQVTQRLPLTSASFIAQRSWAKCGAGAVITGEPAGSGQQNVNPGGGSAGFAPPRPGYPARWYWVSAP